MVTPGPDKVPVFDGRGSSFLDFEQHVLLWMRAMEAELASRASLSALLLHSAPRQVCLAAGGDYLGHQDGVARSRDIPRNYFALVSENSIRHEYRRGISPGNITGEYHQ